MADDVKGNYDVKFLEAIDFAFKKCRFNFVPKSEQLQAIHAVVTGNDVFVKVATGFGNSVCYVVVPYVCDFLRSESHVSTKSVLLIVSPLKTLMEDQMDDIRKCGISCLKRHVELPKEQLHDVGALKYQILICSPESLYEESVREQLRKLQINIVCMAVDEAHCVLQRGKEFLTAYGDLKQVRALLMHGVPVMALTATATHDMMKSIALALGVYQCTVVKRSSNQPNIYYEVQRMQNFAEEEFEKWKELLESIFGGIVSDLKTNGDAASKVIIFCFLKNDCALVYEYFLHKLGSQNLVNMFTNINDDTSKKYMISQFCSPQSRLRVVIATVAFGMGKNCPDVSQVIHFRSPCSLLNYAQESGRCGRDGRQAVAKLCYSNKEFGICSSKFNRKTTKYQSEIADLMKMKLYVSNKSECRRLLLLRYFDGEADAKQETESMSIPNHNCCDVCRNVCNCEECLLIQAMDLVEVEDKEMTDQPPETEKRVLSGDQRECIEKQLLQLRASLLNTPSLLSPDHSTGFTSNVVKQIVENCETVFNAEDVLQKTDVLDPILAQNIIDIVEMEANR